MHRLPQTRSSWGWQRGAITVPWTKVTDWLVGGSLVIPPLSPPATGTDVFSSGSLPTITTTGITGYIADLTYPNDYTFFVPVFSDGTGKHVRISYVGSCAPEGTGSGTVTYSILQGDFSVSPPVFMPVASQTLPLPAGGSFSLFYETDLAVDNDYYFSSAHSSITGDWGGNLHENSTTQLSQSTDPPTVGLHVLQG